MTSTSQPSRLNMLTPLETIPNEIFDTILSYLVPPTKFMFLPCLTTILPLRLVSKELDRRLLDRYGPECFSCISAEFNPVGMTKLLQRVHTPAARTFCSAIVIQMTTKETVLASPTAPHWERNHLGYVADPANIYEIRALGYILNYINWLPVRLRYNDIHEYMEKVGWEHEVSLAETIESILAICAAARLPLKAVDLCDSRFNNEIIVGGPEVPTLQWDMSIPLLEAACIFISNLTIELMSETKDLKWVQSFLVKCSNLKTLDVSFISRLFDDRGLPHPTLRHPFFDNIAASPESLPPVEWLRLEMNGFTNMGLMSFVGRFKNTLRSLELYEVSVKEDGGWVMFFTWLRENAPELREFKFEVLRQGSGEAAKAIFFASFLNSPDAIAQMQREAWLEFDGGILGLMALSSVCEDPSACKASFEGSRCGAQTALGWLAQIVTPAVPPDNYTRSTLVLECFDQSLENDASR